MDPSSGQSPPEREGQESGPKDMSWVRRGEEPLSKCKTGETWLVLSEVHSDSEEPLFTTPNIAVFVLITRDFQPNLHSSGDQEWGSSGKAHLPIHFVKCLKQWIGARPATVCGVF